MVNRGITVTGLNVSYAFCCECRRDYFIVIAFVLPLL
jgi:hypothetical protein